MDATIIIEMTTEMILTPSLVEDTNCLPIWTITKKLSFKLEEALNETRKKMLKRSKDQE